MIDQELGKRIIALRERVVPHFTSGDWEEIAFLSGTPEVVTGHHRLLRSLSWSDEDYDGNVLSVLGTLADFDTTNLDRVEALLNRKYPDLNQYVSAKPSEKKLTFAPHVFSVPDFQVERDLVAVMMPFSSGFGPVHNAIKIACEASTLRCLRADDLWEHATIIQDIFNLLLRSHIVVVDFTGRNPNVMYETGIAHTLGKLVIPISQSLDDVPFDMKHHRVLKYLPNEQGYRDLAATLTKKLSQI
jgi:hypothetical protein